MQPEEYKALEAFRDLIVKTISTLRGAGSQGALGSALAQAAPDWEPVDADFANVLKDLRQQVWSMPFAQVRPVVDAVCGHLEQQLEAVNAEL